MTYTAVGSYSGASASGALATFSLTTSTIGDFVMAEVIGWGGRTPTALSSSNATWVPAGTAASCSVNPNFSGTGGSRAQVFTGTVTAASTATVTITWSGSGSNFEGAVWQEYSTTTGVPVLDKQATLDSTGTNVWPSITPVAAGELYFGYALNNTTAIAGSTSGYVYSATADPAGNGTAYNLNCPGSSTGPTWSASDPGEGFGTMVLVMPAPSAARPLPALPGQTWLRRFHHPQQPPSVITAAAAPAAAWLPPFTRLEVRLPAARRGRVFRAPAAPPAVPSGAARAEVRFPAWQRRSRIFTVPPPPPAAAAPVWLPPFTRLEVRLPAARRPRTFTPPPPAPAPPPQAGRRGRAQLPSRRWRLSAPPFPPPAVPGQQPLPPAYQRILLRARLPQPRGRIFQPFWPQIIIGPQVLPPAGQRAQLRAKLPAPRGRLFAPPYPPVVPGGQQPLPPAFQRQDWRPRLPVRRAAVSRPPVPPGAPAPRFCRTSARPQLPARRGHAFCPPWPQVVVAPPAYPPRFCRTSARPQLPQPRGRRFIPPRPPAPVPQPCTSRRQRHWAFQRRGHWAGVVFPGAPPPPFTIGTLTAADKALDTLTAAGSSAALGASGAALAALTAADAPGGAAAGHLTATDTRTGGPG